MDPATRFLDLVQRNPVNVAILDRADELRIPDWWLAAGALGQTVWNVLDGRDPNRGIEDHDLCYFDPSDLSYAAEDRVIRRAARLFADLDGRVEVRNQARVHLWYERRFGVPAAPFTSTTDAIDHFPTTATCLGVCRRPDGRLRSYAPFGYTDLFGMRVRPNPRLAPREVYERKVRRWAAEWPRLVVEPWPSGPEPGAPPP